MAMLGFQDNIPSLFHKHDFSAGNRTRGYEFLNVISRGASGVVYRARDKKTDEIVAVKEELHGLSPSTLTEIGILKSLPRHPSVVGFKRVVTEGPRILVVMEHIKYDLKSARAAKRKPFSLHEIKFLVAEILNGVAFLHDNGVMHRDLKPANILLGKGNAVKICDFGLSARSKTSCGHVGTRWYKAPEVLVGSNTYTSAVDVWSVGCMMAEFVLDRPLFEGQSDAHQLYCIREVLCGPADLLRLRMCTEASSFSGVAGTTLTRSGHDLLGRLLEYDPRKRISAREALDHAWFKESFEFRELWLSL